MRSDKESRRGTGRGGLKGEDDAGQVDGCSF